MWHIQLSAQPKAKLVDVKVESIMIWWPEYCHENYGMSGKKQILSVYLKPLQLGPCVLNT